MWQIRVGAAVWGLCSSFYLAMTLWLCGNTIFEAALRMRFRFSRGQNQAVSPNCRPEDGRPFFFFFCLQQRWRAFTLFSSSHLQKNYFSSYGFLTRKKTCLFIQINREGGFLFFKLSSPFSSVWEAMNLSPFKLWFVSWKKMWLSQQRLSYQDWLRKGSSSVKVKIQKSRCCDALDWEERREDDLQRFFGVAAPKTNQKKPPERHATSLTSLAGDVRGRVIVRLHGEPQMNPIAWFHV